MAKNPGIFKRNKRKSNSSPKDKSRKADIKRYLLWGAVGLFALAVLFLVWVVATTDLGVTDSMNNLNMKLSSIIYCQNPETEEWEEYEYLISDGNRIWADIDEIPNYMEDAFIAIEDQRFLNHHGVDWKRTAGAVMNEIFGGGSTYGGSSITQQLVKNLTGDNDRSYMRKIREIVRALSVERKFSKQQILELYLNSIYLGQGCYGVEAASQAYFDKPVSQLSLAEAASIAGITQYPSLYDPFANRDKNIEKQRTILAKMLELGYIGQEEYDEAVAEELEFVRGQGYSNGSQSYFVDQVVEDVIDDLREEYGYSETVATQIVYNGGLKIYATVNRKAQTRAETVFADESNIPKGNRDEKIQAAMAIVEPSTGYVKALVGGRGEKTLSRGLNRATQTTRQPGSTIKPLSVYAPALDLGLITPDSIVEDEPINIGGWSPKNHYNDFYGSMSVRRAVNISANIPAVKVLEKVSINKSFDYMANKLNFSTLVDKEERNGKTYTDKTLASLALGGLTYGVKVIDMAAAYASFANEGTYIEPITYTRVEDNAGKTVLEKEQKRIKAFKPSAAYQTNQLLMGVVNSGTGVGASISGIETGGKTGTTDNDTDRWFAGYTPYYSAVVWVGYDSSHQLPSFSSNPALNLWKKVMPEIHRNLSSKSFSRPAGMSSAAVCYVTGLLATDQCYDEEGNSTAVTRYYDSADMPSEYCDGQHGVPPAEEGAESENTTENGEGTETDGETTDNNDGDNSSEPAPPTETVPEAPPENIIE